MADPHATAREELGLSNERAVIGYGWMADLQLRDWLTPREARIIADRLASVRAQLTRSGSAECMPGEWVPAGRRDDGDTQ